ncbi:MAG: YebC/PmpR family DNA-binding transcriptional regulator [Brevinematales bacterium]|nr:YebC/PmpR family DNA-binding transcriptional regulator [Brevinematales bacterium]
MSGHNKWANIKQRKGAQDAKRSNVFSKFVKEIIVAAKEKGGNPDTNNRLKVAIDKAKSVNMPKDTIEKAIKRGTGELEGISYEEISYEGYGPGGVAVIVDTMTDNKNRTAAEIRKIFSKHNGSLGEAGCVAWMFDRKGYIGIDGTKHTEDAVMEIALEIGADDVVKEGDTIEVYTSMDSFHTVLEDLKAKGLTVTESEISRIPQNTIKLEKDKAFTLLKLMDELENHDDVQDFAQNADIDDSIMEEFMNS